MKESIKTRLLLVDDEPIILNTLTKGLTELGYDVANCDDPQQALDIYMKETFDLVVLDYSMPKINGLQLARKMLELRHCPIIMLSAYNDLPLVREAVGAGVSSYLVKPVEAERLAPSIEAVVARFAELTAMLEQGANIQVSVESHRLISTAVGIVMVKTNSTQDQAFENLRRLARDQRRPLKDVAFDLVDSVSTANATLSQFQ